VKPGARAGVAGAGVWLVAHAILLAPRGFPAHQPGEWEVLLTARALASGDVLAAPVGTIHGFEFGSYLLAALAAIPIAAGLDAVLVSKALAAAVGASLAGLLTAWAWAVAEERGTSGPLAAGAAALLIAGLLPAWHAATAGLNGSTVEGLLPQVAAMMLATRPRPDRRRALACGALIGLAWTFGPTALGGLVLVSLLLHGRGARGREAVGFGAGIAAAWLLPALLLPGGFGSLAIFVDGHLSGWLSPVGGDGPGPWAFPLRAPGAAAGGAVVGTFPLGAAWSVAAPAIAIGAAAWAVRRRDVARGLFVCAAFWWVALPGIPWQYRTYPPAYRYWLPALLSTAAVTGVLIAGARSRPAAVALVALCVAGLATSTLKVPPTDLEHSLFTTATHRLGVPADRPPDEVFEALAPHVPADARFVFGMGHGVLRAVALRRSAATVADLPTPRVDRDLSAGFLFGWGCGLTLGGPPDAALLGGLDDRSREDRNATLRGITRCLAAPERAVDIDAWFLPLTLSGGGLRAVGAGWNGAQRPLDELLALAPVEHHEALRRGFRAPRDRSLEHPLVGDLWRYVR